MDLLTVRLRRGASARGRAWNDVARAPRRLLGALLCACAVLAAGCHNNNNASGYGIAWVTLTDEPGDFASYIVTVESITLTRTDGYVATALATPETVDFTKLRDVSELWGTATIPIGTYVSASIVIDYSTANISVMVNGRPQKATVLDTQNAAPTTVTVHVVLDPAKPLIVPPTFATTSAQRLVIDFNLAASGYENLATSPATVYVRPYMTVAVSAPDDKLIRIRGPLINSSVDLNTYTVYVRPFYDEENNLGSLTLFNDASTVFTINGVVSTGSTGVNQLSQSSAGTTIALAFATFEPTATPSATAGIFHAKYVVAGSTLEDIYTQGLEGDVIARSGDTLTVRGATLQFNDGTSLYDVNDSTVVLGPSTIVTADDNASLVHLTSASVGVGQHIIARGLYSSPSAGVVKLDSTGSSATNTGSVRLITTQLYGSLTSAASGSIGLDLQSINNWPVTNYAFTGNGATATPTAANFLVDTGSLALPAVTAGDPLWVNGLVTAFGSAPPDFDATAINAETTQPATLEMVWDSGATNPFSTLTASGFTVDFGNAHLSSALVRLGSERVDLLAMGTSPQVIPVALPAATTLPAVFLPQFSIGNPKAVDPEGVHVFSVFSTYVTELTTVLQNIPALHLVANGTYDRAANTFTATSIGVVL